MFTLKPFLIGTILKKINLDFKLGTVQFIVKYCVYNIINTCIIYFRSILLTAGVDNRQHRNLQIIHLSYVGVINKPLYLIDKDLHYTTFIVVFYLFLWSIVRHKAWVHCFYYLILNNIVLIKTLCNRNKFKLCCGQCL